MPRRKDSFGLALAMSLALAASGEALAENVYYCTDAESAGIVWDKKSSDGDSALSPFNGQGYVMKVISKKRRNVTITTGELKGHTKHLTCRVAWRHEPTWFTCTERTGSVAWAFKGSKYTRANLAPLGGDNNIYVSHGTCVKK